MKVLVYYGVHSPTDLLLLQLLHIFCVVAIHELEPVDGDNESAGLELERFV